MVSATYFFYHSQNQKLTKDWELVAICGEHLADLLWLDFFFRSRVSASPTSPTWLRGASKLLDSGLNCDSWRHLGELLGYKEVKLDQFESSYQPSKTLLKDWLESSKGSELSVEMLLACLKELRRFDVIDVISESEGKIPFFSFISTACF